MRKEHLRSFAFYELLIIAIANNPANCFIEHTPMLRLTKTVVKHKIRVPINGRYYYFHYVAAFCFEEHLEFPSEVSLLRKAQVQVLLPLLFCGND